MSSAAGRRPERAGVAAPGGRRLGEPVELPWWAPVAMLPPVTVLVGTAVAGTFEARLVGAIGSIGMLTVVALVAVRVQSRNLQSVWLSAAYGVWFFCALIWAVEAGLIRG